MHAISDPKSSRWKTTQNAKLFCKYIQKISTEFKLNIYETGYYSVKLGYNSIVFLSRDLYSIVKEIKAKNCTELELVF